MLGADENNAKSQEARSWEPLTAEEVAAILRVPKRRVHQLGIPAVALGPNTLRWLREDVGEFARKRRVGYGEAGRKR